MCRQASNRYSEKYPLLHSGSNESYLHYAALLDEAKGFLPQGDRYLNSALHDARVLAIDWDHGAATVWINDYPTHCFCHAFGGHSHEKKLNWDAVFPVGLRFHRIKDLTLSRISRNDKILPISKTRYLPFASEILGDEASTLSPDRVELGLLFDSRRLGNTNKCNLLLEISCKRIEFIEQQRDRFISLLGGAYLDLFDAFWAARCDGVQFDYSESLKYIQQWKLRNS